MERACGRTPPRHFDFVFLLQAGISCGRHNTTYCSRNKPTRLHFALIFRYNTCLPDESCKRYSGCLTTVRQNTTLRAGAAHFIPSDTWPSQETSKQSCLRTFRQTGSGPLPMHSGRQRRAVRTCHHSHGRRHTMFVFSPLPSTVVLEDANSTLDFRMRVVENALLYE